MGPEITRVPRAPDGAEEVPGTLSRSPGAHEVVLIEARDAAGLVVMPQVSGGGAQTMNLHQAVEDTASLFAGLFDGGEVVTGERAVRQALLDLTVKSPASRVSASTGS
ncbi:hypothetical protein [Actinomadura sp. NPDC000600]|uniref:hypothetical protein n=1 Tax=Actinomadura sp. NPDC000600 TaxID=3154262 RepID=UPI003394936D